MESETLDITCPTCGVSRAVTYNHAKNIALSGRNICRGCAAAAMSERFTEEGRRPPPPPRKYHTGYVYYGWTLGTELGGQYWDAVHECGFSRRLRVDGNIQRISCKGCGFRRGMNGRP